MFRWEAACTYRWYIMKFNAELTFVSSLNYVGTREGVLTIPRHIFPGHNALLAHSLRFAGLSEWPSR